MGAVEKDMARVSGSFAQTKVRSRSESTAGRKLTGARTRASASTKIAFLKRHLARKVALRHAREHTLELHRREPGAELALAKHVDVVPSECFAPLDGARREDGAAREAAKLLLDRMDFFSTAAGDELHVAHPPHQ